MIYPPPSYALTAWLVGDQLMLGIPEAGTVPIPLDRLQPQTNAFGEIAPGNRGLAVLLDILRARMVNRAPTIGERAATVRYDVEQAISSSEKYKGWLAAMQTTKEQKAEAAKMLEELGL